MNQDMEKLIGELDNYIKLCDSHDNKPTVAGIVSIVSVCYPSTENKGKPPCKVDPSFNCDELTAKPTAPFQFWEDVRLFQNRLVINGSSNYGKQLNEIISRYTPTKSEGGLREALVNIKDCLKMREGLSAYDESIFDRVFKELSRHPSPMPEDEPLEKLADRKGFYITCWCRRPKPSKEYFISVAPIGVKQGTHFCEDGYKRTESKAREYLSALPDTDNRGGR